MVGVDGNMSELKDQTDDDWRGPTIASGKHLMSYRVGGVGLGSEQEQSEIERGPYQPKTATADLMVMPPSRLLRI